MLVVAKLDQLRLDLVSLVMHIMEVANAWLVKEQLEGVHKKDRAHDKDRDRGYGGYDGRAMIGTTTGAMKDFYDWDHNRGYHNPRKLLTNGN